MGLHPEKAVSEILTSLKYEWKGSHHCNGRKPCTQQQTLSSILCKNINMIFHCIWRWDWWTHDFFFFKFTHKSQNLLVPSLIFLLSISKLEAPSNHLKPLKKKKKKGLFLWGIFWRLKETFAFVFVGFFSSFLPEYLIQFQKKTREFITDYCDNTLITVNYRVLKCLFITMSLLI